MTLTKGPSNTFYPAQVDASKNKLIISCQQLQNMASTQDASASGGDEFGPQGPRAPDVMMGWVLFGLDQKNAEEHSLELWWHFQLGWTRTNQEVSQYITVFSCFSRLTGMAPAQDMTRNLLDGSRKGGL